MKTYIITNKDDHYFSGLAKLGPWFEPTLDPAVKYSSKEAAMALLFFLINNHKEKGLYLTVISTENV